MKTVLLTGATGFVGTQILKALTAYRVRVIPIVRFGKEGSLATNENVVRIVRSNDIFQESITWWAEQSKGVDVVIHAAWYVEHGKYLMSEKNMDCLIGSLNLARGAALGGVKRFIGIGTCFEYHIASTKLSVDTPLNPTTPYSRAKASLFRSLSQWLPTQSIELAWCRLFYLYGEGEDERRLIPYIHRRLATENIAELTSGTQTRDFLDVSKAGKVIVKIAMSDRTGPINVCSGIPITVREIAEKIAAIYGRHELLKFNMRPDNPFDPPYVLGIPNYK